MSIDRSVNVEELIRVKKRSHIIQQPNFDLI